MYQVTLFNNYAKAGDTFKMYSVADGEDFYSATPTLEGEFTQNTFMLSNVQLTGRKYGAQLCRDGRCSEEILPVHIDNASGSNQSTLCN